ncbi:MAG: 23S rRNA (uracil(1939)-C(5))-methyltransferase RlmD, partial [Clostridiales bacterium]|nr:23S rRNA (uracil(1939)-C(5))-methyltransferase RlmD [Clostridiales bacterium]
EGIVRSQDMTVFVPFLLLGEKAEIRILKTKGNIAYGKIVELFTPAEERVRPVCPVFGRCGGCQLQHENYRAQLKFKTELVKSALEKIGGIKFSVPPCVASEKEYGYRNKLQMPIGRLNGENAIGFYAERSHRIVKTDACPIHHEWAERVIAAVYKFMDTCGLDGYDEETGEGQLRHIVVRELKGKYIVTLVSAVRDISGIDYFVHLLGEIFKEFSLYLNFHAEKTNVVFGEEFRLIAGSGFYECSEAGIFYEAGAQTFVQVNEGIRGKLYAQAVELVSAGETVIDCYAGGGLLTAMFAKKCGKAYGIEIVPEASACAEKLKERNGLSAQMTNICGDVAKELGALLTREKDATVVLDPPRGGVERSVLKTL